VKSIRFASAAFSALLGLALVAPSASLACEPSVRHCPGMSPALAALCHRAGASVPDCCKKERQAPSRRAPETVAAPELASTPAARPVAGFAAEALIAAQPGAIDFTRAAVFHDLGLFTLHAVFRI
jgi:hypothetical protein